VIRNGAEAEFAVDVPPFSSREFTHRTRQELAFPKVKVTNSIVRGEQLESWEADVDASQWSAAEQLVLLQGTRVYPLQRDGSKLRLSGGSQAIGDYLKVEQNENWNSGWRGGWQEKKPAVDTFREMSLPLLGRSIGVARKSDAAVWRCPPGIVRLCAYLPLAKELSVRNPYLGRQDGWMLLQMDFPDTITNSEPAL
jgi:ribosome modulation factor